MITNPAPWKWRQLGSLLVICAGEGELVDEDFAPCLELHRENHVTRAVSWSLGDVTMTARQRHEAGEAMGDHPAANVTNSILTRGLITAMAWMGKPWKAYPPSELAKAVEDIGVPDGYTVDDVVAVLEGLRDEVEASQRAAS